MEPTLQSPCVRNCCLNGDDICQGCGRSLSEILQWQKLPNAERSAVLVRAAARREQLSAPTIFRQSALWKK